MNLKMAAKVRFYLRVCLVDIDMNDVIFFSLCKFALSFGRRKSVGLAAKCVFVS